MVCALPAPLYRGPAAKRGLHLPARRLLGIFVSKTGSGFSTHFFLKNSKFRHRAAGCKGPPRAAESTVEPHDRRRGRKHVEVLGLHVHCKNTALARRKIFDMFSIMFSTQVSTQLFDSSFRPSTIYHSDSNEKS